MFHKTRRIAVSRIRRKRERRCKSRYQNYFLETRHGYYGDAKNGWSTAKNGLRLRIARTMFTISLFSLLTFFAMIVAVFVMIAREQFNWKRNLGQEIGGLLVVAQLSLIFLVGGLILLVLAVVLGTKASRFGPHWIDVPSRIHKSRFLRGMRGARGSSGIGKRATVCVEANKTAPMNYVLTSIRYYSGFTLLVGAAALSLFLLPGYWIDLEGYRTPFNRWLAGFLVSLLLFFFFVLVSRYRCYVKMTGRVSLILGWKIAVGVFILFTIRTVRDDTYTWYEFIFGVILLLQLPAYAIVRLSLAQMRFACRCRQQTAVQRRKSAARRML